MMLGTEPTDVERLGIVVMMSMRLPAAFLARLCNHRSFLNLMIDLSLGQIFVRISCTIPLLLSERSFGISLPPMAIVGIDPRTIPFSPEM